MAEAKSINRGPLHTYEITWENGAIEEIQAHQVSWSNKNWGTFGFSGDSKINFMGEFDGRWTLVLSALERDIRKVRDLSIKEPA